MLEDAEPMACLVIPKMIFESDIAISALGGMLSHTCEIRLASPGLDVAVVASA